VAPNLKLPYAYEFNVAVQQALGSRQSLTVAYVGSAGRDLIGALFTYPILEAAAGGPSGSGTTTGGLPNPFAVSPTFQGPSLTVYGNYATSDYDALQAQFQRRFSDGLGATASYTWSHSLDDASNFNGGTAFPLSHNRSNSDFDIRQTFTASLVYDIPNRFRKHPFSHAILGHWSIDPIFHFQTAGPVNIVLRQALQGLQVLTLRPNVIPGVATYVRGANCAHQNGGNPCPGGMGFNKAAIGQPLGATAAQAAAAGCLPGSAQGAFCAPPSSPPTAGSSLTIPFQEGNLGRNYLRGFPLQQLDLDFHRDFPLREHLRLRFEGDFFNVFNHPNFASPIGIMTDSHFGVSRGMENIALGGSGGYNSLYNLGGPRSVQLALKLIF